MEENVGTLGLPVVKTILVIGADTPEFSEETLQDPRIRFWGASGVRKGIGIPDGIAKVVSCFDATQKRKAKLLGNELREARSTGRDIRSWDVPNQVRLREVIREALVGVTDGVEFAQVSEAEPEAASTSVEAVDEPVPVFEIEAIEVVEVVAEEVGIEVVTEVSAPEPRLEIFGGEGDVVRKRGKKKKKENVQKMKMSIADIVRANMAETGGDMDMLVPIVRRQYPKMPLTDLKKAMYAPRAKWLQMQEEATPAPKVRARTNGAEKPAKQRTNGTAAAATPADSLAVRYQAAMVKIAEGTAENLVAMTKIAEGIAALKALEPEIGNYADVYGHYEEFLRLARRIEA